MDRIVFASDALPAGLDDEFRFKLWRDMYTAGHCELDFRLNENKPFSARTEFRSFGEIAVSRTKSTVDRTGRNRRQIATTPRSHFCLVFADRGSPPFVQHQLGRETFHRVDTAMLSTEAEPGEVYQSGGFNLYLVDIPEQLLLARMPHAYDLVSRVLDAAPQTTTHLRRYVEFLWGLDGPDQNPSIDANISAALLDLVALVLGPQSDSAEITRARGLRAARLHDILARIRTDFANPAISAEVVATKLGFSTRYVNRLLYESGAGFAERVMGLRLEKAREMLADRRYDRLKVIDIAHDCGFNDVSHFNRCFRRRFGVTPSDIRFGPVAESREN